MTTVRAATTRLQEIATTFYVGKMSRDEARAAVIDTIFGWIQCARISLWRFDGSPGALTLLCFASKPAGGPLVTVEGRLQEVEFREYFEVLVQNGIYVSHDAMADPHLRPMRLNYLEPNTVRAMLDAAFMVNGRAYGMVCCEEICGPRRWRAEEVAGLRMIVGRLALLMASAADPALWGSPSLPMGPYPLSA
jgi:GAF domain-containing protein